MSSIARTQIGLNPQLGSVLLGEGEHIGAQVDARDSYPIVVVREVPSGTDGDLGHSPGGSRADPLAAAAEPGPLEERDLLVVAARGLVPDAVLLRCRRPRAMAVVPLTASSFLRGPPRQQ